MFRNGRAPILWVAILLAFSAGQLSADFAEPLQMTETEGAASETALSLDPANNVFVLGLAGEKALIELIGPNLRHSFEVPASGGLRRYPDMASNSRGGTFVVFTEEIDGVPHVAIVDNVGERFTEVQFLNPESEDADVAPKLSLDLDGDPHVVWVRGEVFGDVILHQKVSEPNSEKLIASGSNASMSFDRQNNQHYAYTRGRAILYKSVIDGEEGNELPVGSVTSEEGMDTRIVVDEFGNVYVIYTSEGSLYLASKVAEAESFSTPRFVDSGDIQDVQFRVRTGGVLTIAYARDGDVYTVQGISEFLLNPDAVTSTEGVAEAKPSVVVDHCGNLHVAYVVRGEESTGEIHYTNNAADVSADFAAQIVTGEPPLLVRFQDLSSGKVQLWNWDFGDGNQSSEANPTHEYAESGQYSVTLTVFNADRQSTVTKENFVNVQESSNLMEIPDQVVMPNQRGVWFPVYATHSDPIQGFQVHALYDPNYLSLVDCTQELSSSLALQPDIWECNIFDRSVEIGCIFELEPPFEHPELRAGDRQALVQLIFDVQSGAPQRTSTEIRLTNNSELSRIFNIFTVSGFTKLPVLKSSTVEVLNPLLDRREFFIRGDVNYDGNTDITDAINLLNFLFLGGTEPACMDAADVSDENRIDISSAIGILNYLFLGGRAPAVPFPNPGIDPTPDDLSCEG